MNAYLLTVSAAIASAAITLALFQDIAMLAKLEPAAAPAVHSAHLSNPAPAGLRTAASRNPSDPG